MYVASQHYYCMPVGKKKQLPSGRYSTLTEYKTIGGQCVVRKTISDKTVRQNEIRALKLMHKTSHPALMKVYCWQHLCSKRANGVDVISFMQGERCTVQHLIQWARQLFSALNYMHARHLVHGDVKPENVVVHGNELVLIDFGCAGLKGHRIRNRPTDLYLPPERVNHLWPSTDVWCAGLTLLVAWTHCLPLYSPNKEVVWARVDTNNAINGMQLYYSTNDNDTIRNTIKPSIHLDFKQRPSAQAMESMWQSVI